jgi:ferredoxin
MKVTIQPGCISCGMCEFIAPEVFEVEVTAKVRQGCHCEQFKETIKRAAVLCPVGVIILDEGSEEK